MVAPSLTLAECHSKDGLVQSSDDITFKAAPENHNHGAICFVTPASIDSSSGEGRPSSEEGRHGNNYCNGDIKGPTNCNHSNRVIKEPQINVDECGIHGIKEGKESESNEDNFVPWESDAMCQEPTTKITSRAHDMSTAQKPTKSTEPITCAPKGKRVQWNDNHGKELVHVFEYGMSDTGESEEDEDDTDTCACTIQ